MPNDNPRNDTYRGGSPNGYTGVADHRTRATGREIAAVQRAQERQAAQQAAKRS